MDSQDTAPEFPHEEIYEPIVVSTPGEAESGVIGPTVVDSGSQRAHDALAKAYAGTRLLDSPRALIDVIEDAVLHHRGEIWWRGHAKWHWELVPKTFRTGTHNPEIADAERHLCARFFQLATSRDSNHPGFNDLSGWLYLMQHHGLATRLLDWTETPLVALYFAVCEHPDHDGALWCLDPFTLNGQQAGMKTLFSENSPTALDVFRPALQEEAPPMARIIALLNTERSARMRAQHSRFTIHGMATAVEQLPTPQTFCRMFRIPRDAKPALKWWLQLLGIRLSTIFPDLDHLSADLGSQAYFNP